MFDSVPCSMECQILSCRLTWSAVLRGTGPPRMKIVEGAQQQSQCSAVPPAMQLQQHLDCCHLEDFMSKERIGSTFTRIVQPLLEKTVACILLSTRVFFSLGAPCHHPKARKKRCTTDIRMRFLLTILASQDPRPGCLHSHGRAGTTTLRLTVVQVLQRPCTMDD